MGYALDVENTMATFELADGELMNAFHYIISFVGVMSVVVFVHEFGHYIAAKLCGVHVEVFSIGFGPEICGINTSSGTRWKISLLPLGGYVKMLGDMDLSSSIAAANVDLYPEELDHAFHNQSLLKKFIIVAAGPLINLALGVVLIAGILSFRGSVHLPAEIGTVIKGSPAAVAGLKSGDVIVRIGNSYIRWFEDIRVAVMLYSGQTVDLLYRRHEKEQQINVVLEAKDGLDNFGNKIRTGVLGITAVTDTNKLIIEHLNPLQATGRAFTEVVKIVQSTGIALKQMIVGTRSTNELSGPIRIAKYSSQSLKGGVAVFILFIAMISVNLGIVNLLPIPMLDGGHLFHYLLEGVFGFRFGQKYHKFVTALGIVIVVALTAVATFNDVVDVFR